MDTIDWQFSSVGDRLFFPECLCLLFEAFCEVIRQEVREWEIQVYTCDAVFPDPDPLEGRLIQGSADFVGRESTASFNAALRFFLITSKRSSHESRTRCAAASSEVIRVCSSRRSSMLIASA